MGRTVAAFIAIDSLAEPVAKALYSLANSETKTCLLCHLWAVKDRVHLNRSHGHVQGNRGYKE